MISYSVYTLWLNGYSFMERIIFHPWLSLGVLLSTIALIWLIRVIRETLKFDIPDICSNSVSFEGWEELAQASFAQTGTMEMSQRLKLTLYRLHERKYFWEGSEFYKTFEDSDLNADQEGRFSGRGIGWGYYFSLSPEGARAEAQHYKCDLQNRKMLVIEADFNCLLDLTYEENIKRVITKTVDIEPGLTLSNIEMLSVLIEAAQGGDYHTRYIGRWARQSEYDGILFFGIRAIQATSQFKVYIDHGRDDDRMGLMTIHMHMREMRRDLAIQNIVIFSGALLTTRILSYSFDGAESSLNPYYNADTKEIEKSFRLDENGRYLIHGRYSMTKPRIVSTERGRIESE